MFSLATALGFPGLFGLPTVVQHTALISNASTKKSAMRRIESRGDYWPFRRVCGDGLSLADRDRARASRSMQLNLDPA
eukprot:SAG31_NODE_36242_length_315_cov_0.722222_1_plen_78_part_01